MRAIANVVLARPDDALADAMAAAELAGPGDPDALNHRAYVRALVGRDLPTALVDIEAALAGDAEPAFEMLDTRGFVQHLTGISPSCTTTAASPAAPSAWPGRPNRTSPSPSARATTRPEA